MSEVYTYSPQDVKLVICGYIVEDWVRISIDRNSPVFRQIRGIRGKNTRVKNRDTSAVIALEALMVGQVNDVLSEIVLQDSILNTGRLEVGLIDTSGRSVFTTVESFVEGYPSVTFSADIETRTWRIMCNSTDGAYVVGGNSKPITSLFDSALELFNN